MPSFRELIHEALPLLEQAQIPQDGYKRQAWGLNFYAEALKEAIRRSAADPGNVAEGLYEDLESEIYTPEHQSI